MARSLWSKALVHIIFLSLPDLNLYRSDELRRKTFYLIQNKRKENPSNSAFTIVKIRVHTIIALKFILNSHTTYTKHCALVYYVYDVVYFRKSQRILHSELDRFRVKICNHSMLMAKLILFPVYNSMLGKVIVNKIAASKTIILSFMLKYIHLCISLLLLFYFQCSTEAYCCLLVILH